MVCVCVYYNVTVKPTIKFDHGYNIFSECQVFSVTGLAAACQQISLRLSYRQFLRSVITSVLGMSAVQHEAFSRKHSTKF